MNSKSDSKPKFQIRREEDRKEPLIQIKETSQNVVKKPDPEKIMNILDENLVTLKKVHAILMNCINLTKKQKLEFAESERYFMKSYLKKLSEKLGK
jgi:hypothetical protein